MPWIEISSTAVPDGLIACLFGPMNGNQHDSFMLCISGILEQLQELMPLEDSITYKIYGDPAYPKNNFFDSGYCNAAPGSAEAQYNAIMSASHIA